MTTFSSNDLPVVAPELFLLGATCVVLLIDLFIRQARRNLTHWLTIAALAVTGLLVWNRALPNGSALFAFNDMFVLDG
ncbi:MAG TPA: NADH:ubiquinone oxidoreductase subunit N, partial [Rhodanobacteraceae bacterium]|nr:NADH:ubiquinone oxidoreductase subunit N [Rhodanobacteraceae bacterium]